MPLRSRGRGGGGGGRAAGIAPDGGGGLGRLALAAAHRAGYTSTLALSPVQATATRRAVVVSAAAGLSLTGTRKVSTLLRPTLTLSPFTHSLARVPPPRFTHRRRCCTHNTHPRYGDGQGDRNQRARRPGGARARSRLRVAAAGRGVRARQGGGREHQPGGRLRSQRCTRRVQEQDISPGARPPCARGAPTCAAPRSASVARLAPRRSWAATRLASCTLSAQASRRRAHAATSTSPPSFALPRRLHARTSFTSCTAALSTAGGDARGVTGCLRRGAAL